MRLQVEVSLQRFDARVQAAKAKLQNPAALVEIAKAGADIFEAEAKALAPVDDGDLRDSIHQEVIETSATRARIAVAPDVPYAKRIEFGHSKPDRRGRKAVSRAHPYMRPAYDGKKDEAKQANIDAGNSLIREALKP